MSPFYFEKELLEAIKNLTNNGWKICSGLFIEPESKHCCPLGALVISNHSNWQELEYQPLYGFISGCDERQAKMFWNGFDDDKQFIAENDNDTHWHEFGSKFRKKLEGLNIEITDLSHL